MTGKSSRPDDTLHVLCAADANYGPYAGIMMHSVLRSNVGEPIHLHLLSDGVRSRDLDRMAQMAQRVGADFSNHDIAKILDGIGNLRREINHYTRTAYGRLFFPEFAPAEVRRALYFDCDMVCISSLRDLWAAGDQIHLLGAARDPWVEQDIELKRELGMRPDSPYFNSGMLLINMESWRQEGVSERVRAFLSAPPKTKHADQDVINAVLKNEISELPSRWNTLVEAPSGPLSAAELNGSAILHFCGGLKPWHAGYRLMGLPGAAHFKQAKQTSPWRWTMPDLHTGRVRRKIRRLLRKYTPAPARDYAAPVRQ
jgi:lipopolysaccharide biosynthesis glycosyltransferase